MRFKVSFKGSNGHEDDPSVDDSDNEPDTYTFDTDAERTAFIQGCRITEQTMSGWVNASVEVERIEAEALPPPHKGYDEAREFLLTVADQDHEVAAVKIQEWIDTTPPGVNRIVPLIQAARSFREDGPFGGTPEGGKVLDLLDVLKEALLSNG
jgi:hypothetical protein